MSNLGVLIFAVVVAAAVWFFSPQVEPAIGETWLIGAGKITDVMLSGREIVTAVVELIAWIAGLHIARA